MLFAHMSLWAIALTLVVMFTLKHFAVDALFKTDFAQERTEGQGWVASLLTNAVVNAILTALLLLFFVGSYWALVLGVVDGAVLYLFGYWKKRHHAPHVDANTLIDAYKVISFLQTNSYLGIVAFVVKYVFPHSPIAAMLPQTPQ